MNVLRFLLDGPLLGQDGIPKQKNAPELIFHSLIKNYQSRNTIPRLLHSALHIPIYPISDSALSDHFAAAISPTFPMTTLFLFRCLSADCSLVLLVARLGDVLFQRLRLIILLSFIIFLNIKRLNPVILNL